MALIPAFNAESTIARTINALRTLQEVEAILVVDDGSTDRTAEVARGAGAEVIAHERNMGKGAALNTGLVALRGKHWAALALVDSDLGNSAAAFASLLQPVVAGDADMTIARFPSPTRRGGFGVAKTFCRLGLYAFTRIWFVSPMSGQRVLSASAVARLPGFAQGWGCEPALTIDLHRLGARIVEVPVEMAHAETSRTFRGFVHRGRQLLAAARVFLMKALERRHF